MTRKLRSFFAVLLTVCSLLSCKKNLTSEPPPPTSEGVDVYLLGAIDDTLAYWKNDTVAHLSDGSAYEYPGGIAVSNGNVYIAFADWKKDENYIHAEYAINGKVTPLTGGPSNAGAGGIVVAGTDFYISGAEHDPYNPYAPYNVALYFTRTAINPLSDGSMYDASTSGITLSGADIYLSGNETINNTNVPVYWKNGNPVKLDTKGNTIYTSGIAVLGTDVYVCGNLSNRLKQQAVYWKNGVLSILSDSSVNTSASKIIASSSDIYIAGSVQDLSYQQRHASYWKNGVEHLISTPDYSEAYTIAVSGNDVYLGGKTQTNTGQPAAIYWKNDVPAILSHSMSFSSNGSFINDIALNPRKVLTPVKSPGNSFLVY